jgi:hypothetical protein
MFSTRFPLTNFAPDTDPVFEVRTTAFVLLEPAV